MSGNLPPFDAGSDQYERPNQKWICGRAAEGHACQIGPGRGGLCRATFECRPAFETKPGESKGRYRCTRPAELGGPCEFGPQPDGTCCRAIPKCAPVRSLRAKRGVLILSVIGFTVGALLVLLYSPVCLPFIAPNALSTRHSNIALSKHTVKTLGVAGGKATCAACHDSAAISPPEWLKTAFQTRPGLPHLRQLLRQSGTGMTTIDLACQQCHVNYNFHQPDVVQNHSCSSCHREHQGSGPMKAPTDADCLSCHGNSSVMATSGRIAASLPSSAFDLRNTDGQLTFVPPRPPLGYTKVMHSFAGDHPEFQVIAQGLKESDTLKFNHQRHLAGDIPTIKGVKLDCDFCHKPNVPPGVNSPRITYEANCKVCHALQFDAHNPDLLLPHGDAALARAFLHSLPTQYADLARRARGLSSAPDIATFVTRQMQQIRNQAGSGEGLEGMVFFAMNPAGVMQPGGQNRTGFPACVLCHEVKANGEATPIVTKPYIPDRWMVRANFPHIKHTSVSCRTCHLVEHSRETSDIILPGKDTCTTCHSPAGGVPSTCITCHNFHPKDITLTSR